MTSEVISEGYEEANKPSNEPVEPINPIPAIIKNTCERDVMGIESINMNIIMMSREIKNEYKREARNIPDNI